MRQLTPAEYLELSYRITATLAESPDPQSAVRDVLSLLCRTLDFDAGGFWVVHDVKAVLRCLSFWSRNVAEFPHFELVTRVRDLAHGQGMTGIAWETRQAVCFPDVATDRRFVRASVAQMDGLHMGIAFPAHRLREVFGIFEFFSRETAPCPEETLQFCAALGIQIGVFLGHYHIKDLVIEDVNEVRLAAERLVDAGFTIDERSIIIFANSAVFSVFGYEPQELIGGSLTQIMPSYLRHVHEQGIARYVSTGTRHLDWSAIDLPGLHKNGNEIPLRLEFGEFWRNGKRVFTGFAKLNRGGQD